MRQKHVRLFCSVTLVIFFSFLSTVEQTVAGESDRRPVSKSMADLSAGSGLQVGETFQDMQKYGSMGRQIATRGLNHIINFCWTNKYNADSLGGKNVRFNAWDPLLGFLNEGSGGADVGPSLDPPDLSGFITMDATDASGHTVVAFEWDTNAPVGPMRPWVGYNATPGVADFAFGQIPDAVWTPHLSGDATVFRWPQVAYTNNGAGTEVTHLLIFSDRTDGDGKILYVRKVGSGLAGTWSSAMLVGSGGFHRSGVIVASRNTNFLKVAIVWAGGRGDGSEFGASVSRYNGFSSGQLDNDLYYMTSEDAGASWGPIHNITQRPILSSGGYAPHAKLTALYSSSTDTLNIAWQAAAWNGYGGTATTGSSLFFWSQKVQSIRMVRFANWSQPNCDGGAFNLNVSNPQLSVCDSKLYLTYSQFNDVPGGIDNDCGSRAPGDPTGAANGEIMINVSSNGGLTWDAARNLTQTSSPGCDSLAWGGVCESEVWHTTTRYGIDITGETFGDIPDVTSNIDGTYTGADYLFVQYVSDENAGSAVLAEGSWSLNPVKAFRFGCVADVPSADIVNPFPEEFAIATIDTLVSVTPEKDSVIDWRFWNIGNIALVYSIIIVNDSPPGNVTVTGGTGVIGTGLTNFEDLTITLNAGLEAEPQSASVSIIVDGNFVSAPDTFFVSYLIADSQASCDVPGDADGGGSVNIGDATFIVKYIFQGGAAPPRCDQGDADGGGSVNIGDATYVVKFVFQGGAAPTCPTPGNLECL